MNYHAAKAYILGRLKNGLSDKLTYHSLYHTLDVLQVSTELCTLENINAYETNLLKTAALYHDTGFLVSSRNHEQLSCGIARHMLPKFKYSSSEIERICGMIMATKIPQSPQNKLEEILCDADLDYLGRADFERIGATLFEELKTQQVLDNLLDWNKIQIRFLEAHTFFTITNQQRRSPTKHAHLLKLKNWLAEAEIS
ncbi:MAG: HD domain-containing protein, partial [Bacteroidota bacterium]